MTVACEKQDNNVVSEEEENKLNCLLYSLEWKNQVGTGYEYSGSTTCTYDENNTISELIYEYEGSFTQEIFSYDEQGRVSTLLHMYDDIAFHKIEFSWGNNSLDFVHLENAFGSDEWSYSSLNPKILYQFNIEGQIIKEEYFVYSSENMWEKSSSYKEYEWSGGNIRKELTYIGSNLNSLSNNSKRIPQNSLKYFQNKSTNDQLIDSIIYIYDNKNNYNTFWGIVAGAKGLNKNNITSRIKYYSVESAEIDTVKIEYEYNEYDYPIKSIATYKWLDTITKDEIVLEYILK